MRTRRLACRGRRIIQQQPPANRLTPHQQPARLPQRCLRRSRITRIRYRTQSSRSRTCSAVRLKRKHRLKPCRIRPAHTRLPISPTLQLPLNRLTAHPHHRVRLLPRRRPEIQIPPTRCPIPNNRCLSFSRTNSHAHPNSRRVCYSSGRHKKKRVVISGNPRSATLAGGLYLTPAEHSA